ncbi:MAG TPA: AraC family transcriptional regulator [Candidatus Nanopelagicales bacterium]|nr:AraC family transcriptional regulator [Candidatus Nanopelagicales bacterium]
MIEALRVFAELVEGIPQVMASAKDTDGRYVFVNAGFCDRVGLPAEQILGLRVDDLFAPEMAASYAAQDAEVLATGTPLRGQLELIVRADGSLGWYVTNKSALRVEEDVVGVAVLSIDLQSQVNSAHAGLAQVIAAVRRDIHAGWRVAQMADVAGLSSPQLERLCRRTLGIPPQKLLQRLRLEHAVQLITATSMSMGDISAECGFYDQASFTRQFRSVLGLTPGAYRRSK